jgi:hypothetical protein
MAKRGGKRSRMGMETTNLVRKVPIERGSTNLEWGQMASSGWEGKGWERESPSCEYHLVPPAVPSYTWCW